MVYLTVVFNVLLGIFGLIFFVVLAMLIQVVIHELGHMIFGLLAGYEFIFIRFFSFMLLKKNGELKFKKLSIPGTGGQCLMLAKAEEDKDKENRHLKLYFYGGIITNAITGVVFLSLSLIFIRRLPENGFMCLFQLGLIGIAFALFNGIPFKSKLIANDARTYNDIKSSEKDKYDFFDALYVSKKMCDGYSIADIDTKYLQLDRELDDVGIHNIQIRAAYHLKNKEQEKHDEISEYIVQNPSKFPGIYALEIKMDSIEARMKTEIIENREDILDKEITKYLKLTKNSPSTILFNYQLAKLVDKDEKMAEKLLKKLEKVKKHYPFDEEIKDIYEDIDETNKIYETRKAN